MTRLVHYVEWSAQADARAACGVHGYLWPSPSDPDGIMQGGDDADPVWFAKLDRPEMTTCPGCRPAADADIERQRAHAAEVEAAGGADAWWAGQKARMVALRARRGEG